MRRCLFVVTAVLLTLAPALVAAQTASPTPPPDQATQTPDTVKFFQAEVLNSYPHDSGSYTQGLLWHEDVLYESAGQTGESDIRAVELESGDVLRKVELTPEDFAEGLALVDDRLIQLTWQQQIAYVYDRETFEPLETFTYDGEGWGLCYDGEVLWRSDGSETLTAHDPETFEVVRELPVTYESFPLSQYATPDGRLLSALNELECVDGFVYANVWYTNFILRIDTTSGQVTGVVDASNLLTIEERAVLDSGAVLNGIAYNDETETFFLTGKYWPKLFEVQFTPITLTGE
jgi:glutaminyl-peptide cyclotransferase